MQIEFVDTTKATIYIPLGRVNAINAFQEGQFKKANLLTIISLSEASAKTSVKAQFIWYVRAHRVCYPASASILMICLYFNRDFVPC